MSRAMQCCFGSIRVMQAPVGASILVALLVCIAVTGTACGDGDHSTPVLSVTPSSETVAPTASSTTQTPTLAAPSATIFPTLPPIETATPVQPVAPSVLVRRIEGSAAVFLTFDAGAGRGYTAEILDILDTEGVRASFGLTGAWVEANPDLVRRIAAAGHTIVNHSYDHPSFTGVSSTSVALTPIERQTQLARTESALADAAETSGIPYFRPPFGDYDQSVLADAGAAGYRFTILWTIDSGGWRGLPAEEIVGRALMASGGDIVIMHVGSAGDYEALPNIVHGLHSRGLRTISIAEALH